MSEHSERIIENSARRRRMRERSERNVNSARTRRSERSERMRGLDPLMRPAPKAVGA